MRPASETLHILKRCEVAPSPDPLRTQRYLLDQKLQKPIIDNDRIHLCKQDISIDQPGLVLFVLINIENHILGL